MHIKSFTYHLWKAGGSHAHKMHTTESNTSVSCNFLTQQINILSLFPIFTDYIFQLQMSGLYTEHSINVFIKFIEKLFRALINV